MSKIGIIADIHGNFPALEKAHDILEKERVDQIIVCGDIVGYGTSPNECCDRIRALSCPVVAGNHDWAVAGLTEYRETHSSTAIKGIVYTREIISEENLHWLQRFPIRHTENGLAFVHASLVEGEKWYYLTAGRFIPDPGRQDVRDSFAVLKGQVCFVGHSHKPRMFLEKQQGDIEVVNPHKASYELQGCRAIIDAGSVGWPRGHSKQASLVIYDSDNQKVRFKHFPQNGIPHLSMATATARKQTIPATTLVFQLTQSPPTRYSSLSPLAWCCIPSPASPSTA